MASPKTTCPTCGTEFLQATADKNGGYCMKCKPGKNSGVDHEAIAGKMELSMRFLLAFVLAIVFAGIGYGIGAIIWSGVGILLALIACPIGFVYGFFCVEINFVIRTLFRSLFHFDGD